MIHNLLYKDHLGTVQYSKEDEIFYGKIFGINDLVNFEGRSRAEMKRVFEEAVEDYIATCEEIE